MDHKIYALWVPTCLECQGDIVWNDVSGHWSHTRRLTASVMIPPHLGKDVPLPLEES